MIRVSLFRTLYLKDHEDYHWWDENWDEAYSYWQERIENGSFVEGVLWLSGSLDGSDDVILEVYP